MTAIDGLFKMAASENHKHKIKHMKQTNTISPQSNKMLIAGTSQLKTIEILFDAGEAHEVFVAGDFNQWNPRNTPLRKDVHGVWKTLLQVSPGRHEYRLVVDGQWQTNPRASGAAANPYGSSNSVVQVG